MKNWIKAFRLRTLPLASAGIILGSLLAWNNGFTCLKFVLLLSTALLLQILSNLANDYGDFVKGTDNANRKGEKRMVASGAISPKAMLSAIILFSILSLASGIYMLIVLSLSKEVLLFFLALGICCIIAAITYTVGKKAYGYSGFGDVAVFTFFGLISVSGSHYLLSGYFDAKILLPAAALGLLATAVLNLNNMRDHENDKMVGKNTLVVKLGFAKAKLYHTILLALPTLLAFVYIALDYSSTWQLLFLFSSIIFIKLSGTVKSCTEPALLDNELKKQALSTLFFALLFALGQLI